MTQTDLDRILDRITALQDMAQMGTPEEAANAVALIERLLTKYNLSMARVNARREAGRTSEEFVLEHFDIGARTQWLARWRRDLLHGLCQHNFCRSTYTARSPLVHIVGEPHNIRAVTELYKWIEGQIRQLTNTHWAVCPLKGVTSQSGERTWRQSFSLGCVATVIARVGLEKNGTVNQMQALEADTTALVLRKDQEADEAFAAHVKTRKVSMRTYAEESGYVEGQQAGNKVSIHQALEFR